MTNKTYKSKFLAVMLGFAMCLVLLCGVMFASGANTALAADGTAPTITHTGGEEVDRKNNMANLPVATVGKEYKASDGRKYKVVATGTAPLTYTAYEWGSGKYSPLPEGLTLDSATGEFSGTPTTKGNYGVSITVTNAFGSDNVLAWINVYDETESKPTITTTDANLATGYVNSSYYENISFDDPDTYSASVSISQGSLPDGLSIAKIGNYSCAITGTPTTAGNYTFTVRVTNIVGYDEREYKIEVKDEIVSPTIITKRQPLGGTDSDGYGNVYGVVEKAFEYQLQATGTNTAENPILFFAYDSTGEEASANAQGEYDLGNGLYLTKEGKIYGTPTTKGQVSFRIGAKNKNISGSYIETGWSSGYCYFQVYEEGTIISLNISPTETSVPKGGQRQFAYKLKSAGEFTGDLYWGVYSKTSSSTTITQNGLLTIGLDETATSLEVQVFDEGRGRFSTAIVTVIDHTHTTVKVPARAADCTTDGNIEHFKCTNCGDLFSDAGAVTSLTAEDVKIPASHTYGDLIAKVEATCSKAGMHAHYECSVCGKLFDESKVEKTESELSIAIDSDAHNLSALIAEVPATCTTTGTKAHKDCSLCDNHYENDGKTKIEDLTIPTNDNHDWNAWVSNGDDTHSRTCKRNAEHKETVNCSGGTATCTQKAVCDVCNTTYGTTKEHTTTQYGGKDESGHWDTCSTCANKLNFEAHTPDRDKADETYDKKCTKCGYVIAPKGHYEHTADSEWHNSADGTYHYHKCTYSGCSEILDKANHSGGKATCDRKAVCEVCGKEYGDVLGHNYGEPTYIWENDVCKAERVCANDGTHKESETVTASGTIVTAASCTEKGKMRYTATFTNTAFATQTREVEIDYAAHTFGAWQDEVAPTTDVEGVKAHKDCTVCGKHFDKDGNEIANIVIAKLGSAIVTVNGGNGAGSYTIGEEVTVKADEAPEGKEFKGWQDASGNIVSTDVEYKFTVSGEVNLTAVYADRAVEPIDPVDPTDPTEPTIDTEEPKGLSGGAIAGIVVGSVAVAGIGGFAIFWFAIKKKSFPDLFAVIKGIFKKK